METFSKKVFIIDIWKIPNTGIGQNGLKKLARYFLRKSQIKYK